MFAKYKMIIIRHEIELKESIETIANYDFHLKHSISCRSNQSWGSNYRKMNC